MNPRRPRPLWPILTAALIGLPVLYVASFGPACWLVNWGALPVRGTGTAYRPLISLAFHGPEGIRQVMRWYADLWLPEQGGPDVVNLGDATGVIRIEANPPF